MTDLSDVDELTFSGYWRVVPKDLDPVETKEWTQAFDAVLDNEGRDRAQFILRKLLDHARSRRVPLPPVLNTPYANTIPLAQQPQFPGNLELEQRLLALVRWNALAMVVRANKAHAELGGHIASYASAAELFEVGYNHFFRAGQTGDLVYFQPHSAPGVYARAFLDGRLTEEQLDNYRRDVAGKGLSSYCHPYLMPTFWQFPTGSMGLGPLTAIYQARFMKYLANRGILAAGGRKVWMFVGDGEMDEPESLAGLSLAAREGLDNLIFVVNCNLQRLDGPVRGNGSIIQELEGLFAGAGWNVIKVLWGSDWDTLFARDTDGAIIKRLHETVDGEFQKYAATDGRFNREHFFNKYPELQALVQHLSDEDIDRLKRGGHDPVKIYAGYHAAVHHNGQPTVILAQTKKGYGMGHWGQGKMTTHQQKKLDDEALFAFRDRFALPLSDEDCTHLRFCKPAADSPEMKYLHARRQALGGYIPQRVPHGPSLPVPALDALGKFLEGTHGREQSTTMVFVQLLSQLLRDGQLGKHIVPIVADEARTFGMQALFRQVAIYSSVGQLYEPEDKDELLYYKEAKDGQILEEGISEAGAVSSWIAAATSYSAHGVPMLPFYVFYSCFGFQRIGDLIWAAGDSRSRGFLLGATAGRTTLSGEGLQHEDGSSHLLFSTVPNCVAYDPCFGYELTVIIQDGMRRMLQDQEDVFYYVTVMNENYVHPAMPEGAEVGVLKGMYKIREAGGVRDGALPKQTPLPLRAETNGVARGTRHEAPGQQPPSPSRGEPNEEARGTRHEASGQQTPSPSRGEGWGGETPSPSRGEGWGGGEDAPRVQLLGSGTILREVLAAAELLEQHWGVVADVWSVTSFTELRRDGLDVERWNRLHPTEVPRASWVERSLAHTAGPIVAATDYMRTVADLIRTWVPRRYVTLGTDGFGRSDTRAALRGFFEVNRHHVTVAALKALADQGSIDREVVQHAIEKYAIDPERRNPWEV